VVAIPLSLIGAVFLMQVFGFTINLLTLLAIVFSVGLVVDDAIVVVENVERHLSEGQFAPRCRHPGARELVGPIIAMTITLAAVYAPIGLQGGLTGSLFREFAFTLAGAVTISGVVALTLSPMMSSKLLKPGLWRSGLRRLESAYNFKRFRDLYGRMLDGHPECPPGGLPGVARDQLLAIPMFIMSPEGAGAHGRPGRHFRHPGRVGQSTLDQTSIYAAEPPTRPFQSVPEDRVHLSGHHPTSGFAGMVVAPWDARERTIFKILPEVQHKLQAKSPASGFFRSAPGPSRRRPVPGGVRARLHGRGGSDPRSCPKQIQLKAMQSGLFAFPPLIDVKIDQPQSEILIDRDKVADLGLNLNRSAPTSDRWWAVISSTGSTSPAAATR
jgi:multidrug efflux pump